MIYPYKLHTGVGVGQGWLGPIGSDASYPYGTYTQNQTTNIFTWSGLKNFSDLTGGGGGTPQPITLLTFNATANEEVVNVDWSTASEINNDYFVVERSINAKNFESVSTVKGAGTHNGLLEYSVIDNNPYNGISYYRLKQVDVDGTSTYSSIKEVEVRKAGVEALPIGMNVIPNPSNGSETNLVVNNLPTNTIVMVQVSDLLGKDVTEMTQATSNTGSLKHRIFTDNLPNGVYLVRVTAGSEIKVIRMVIDK
jgi:hypothetical protein